MTYDEAIKLELKKTAMAVSLNHCGKCDDKMMDADKYDHWLKDVLKKAKWIEEDFKPFFMDAIPTADQNPSQRSED